MAPARPCHGCGELFAPRKNASRYCDNLTCRRQYRVELKRAQRSCETDWTIEEAVLDLIAKGEMTPAEGLLLVVFPPAAVRQAA